MRLILSVLLLTLAPLAAPVHAQGYPERPVTLVVPFAAGGPSDAIGRVIAQRMSRELKQQIVIENVAGVGGTLGSARVVKAAPDGYTLLINDLALPSAPLLKRNLTFNVRADLVPVGVLNTGPMVLIARRTLGIASVGDLAARMKGDSTPLNLGHSGIGSNSHMCGLLLQASIGAKVTEVAYRGAGPAMNDLVGGTLDIMCEQTATALPQVQGGSVVALAVTSAARLPALPSVPTMIEAGHAGFEFVLWHGLYAPSGTPKPIIDVLSQAMNASLDDPEIRARYAEMGRSELPPDARTPAAHAARLEAEIERLRGLLEGAGVKPQE
ncbi:MAG: tripartite tricarboxylate transporter substrate binding protein BugD [Hyphomicrobiales bacterium]|nr:MAG: tripartite tricarboxylate transporter substrate binding protein BugD [Hyphomicrobiales bacterium]